MTAQLADVIRLLQIADLTLTIIMVLLASLLPYVIAHLIRRQR